MPTFYYCYYQNHIFRHREFEKGNASAHTHARALVIRLPTFDGIQKNEYLMCTNAFAFSTVPDESHTQINLMHSWQDKA